MYGFSSLFYDMLLVYGIIIYGYDTWVISVRKFFAPEVAHVGFTRDVMRLWPKQRFGGGWD